MFDPLRYTNTHGKTSTYVMVSELSQASPAIGNLASSIVTTLIAHLEMPLRLNQHQFCTVFHGLKSPSISPAGEMLWTIPNPLVGIGRHSGP